MSKTTNCLQFHLQPLLSSNTEPYFPPLIRSNELIIRSNGLTLVYRRGVVTTPSGYFPRPLKHLLALTTTANTEGSILFLFYDNFLWPTNFTYYGPSGKILKWLVFEYSFLSLTFDLIFGLGVVILNKSRGAHFL